MRNVEIVKRHIEDTYVKQAEKIDDLQNELSKLRNIFDEQTEKL